MTTTATQPKKRRSYDFNANFNRRKRLKEATKNLLANAKRFGWLSSAINRECNNLRRSDDFQRLPASWQSEINGYIDGLRDSIETETTHLHLCNDGKYRAQGEYTYDPLLQHSPMNASGRSLDTCIIVWANKRDHVFFAGEKHLKLC